MNESLNFSKVVIDCTGGNVKIKQSNYLPEGFLPVVDQGKELIAGYVDDDSIKYKGTLPCVIFGDHTCILKYVDFDFVLGADGTKILVPDSDKINAKYLYYFLNTVHIPDRGYSRHFKYLKRCKIPVVSLSEQKQIAKILDTADTLRQKRKVQLNLLDDYLKSVFFEMFGDPSLNNKNWEIREFNYFAKIDTKMTTDFAKYKDYPHIGISNIEKDTGKLFGYKLVKEENLISGKYVFTPEHIIYSKIRPNLNKVALPDFNGLCSADSYPILVHSEHANRVFFTFILRSPLFIDYILKHSKRTNIPKANKEQIKAFKGIAPPVELQNKFVSIVEQVEQTKQKMRVSLDEMDNHFNALMQRYFG